MMDTDQIKNGAMLMVDKPYRWTSFDVVKKLRGVLGIKKIGHAGTLDPLATGLLILCTGKMTKQMHVYQEMEKEYSGTLVLGKTTPSFDLETDFDSTTDISHLTPADLELARSSLTGKIEQVPPRFSAIKVDGQRVYNKARKGQPVKLAPRTVEISLFEIVNCQLPNIDFRVVCSKGTYIRSLVRDFGAHLQVGAYLSALRRTRIGPHRLSEALDMEQILEQLPLSGK